MVDPAGASGGGAVTPTGRGCFDKPHTGRKVRGYLRFRLIRERPRAGQSTIRYQVVTLRIKYRLDRQRARLVPVEFERRQKVHFFDGFHMPAGKHPEGGFGKGFNAHHARQDGRVVDLMIVQERLNLWIQRCLDGETMVKSHACDLADHGSRRHGVG